MSRTTRVPGLVLTEHELSVPLDHARPNGPRISVFAREVAEPEGLEKPFLVYFQGGPGMEATRPGVAPVGPGWLVRALRDFRVLLLDQRGTGRSTPVGTLAGMTPEAQAEYLSHFRADSIVRDAELLREALGGERWSVLGQSFGGFCVTSYLSIAPDGLREALITGGLPPIGRPVDDVYRATYVRMLERNRRYYERYPEDRARVLTLMERIATEDVRLPGGDRLSAERVRTLGNRLGMSDGFESLHHVLELPHDSPGFLHDVQDPMGFARNPLYAIVHEACYADGSVTDWAAARLLPEQYAQSPELLTGEHIFPALFEQYGALAPLRDAAHLLAKRAWPRLHDEAQLRANTVPVAAAIYSDDLYVERTFSEQTAATIRGARAWLTSEYEHNGLRADGGRVLGRLLDLVRGSA